MVKIPDILKTVLKVCARSSHHSSGLCRNQSYFQLLRNYPDVAKSSTESKVVLKELMNRVNSQSS